MDVKKVKQKRDMSKSAKSKRPAISLGGGEEESDIDPMDQGAPPSPVRSADKTLAELRQFGRRQLEILEILQADKKVESGLRQVLKDRLGELPSDTESLEEPEVLLEPFFWPLYFISTDLEMNQIDRVGGLDGEVAEIFLRLCENHYGAAHKLVLNDWQKGKLLDLQRDFKAVARAAVRFPLSAINGAPKIFLREITYLLSSAREALKELDRDLIKKVHGHKAAGKFSAAMKLDPAVFSKRARSALREAVKSSDSDFRSETRPEGRGRGGWVRRQRGRGGADKPTSEQKFE